MHHGKGEERQERLKHVITIGAVVSDEELRLINSSSLKPLKNILKPLKTFFSSKSSEGQ